MSTNRNKRGVSGMTKKKSRKATLMRIFFIIIIFMISVGLVGGSFLILL